MLAKNCVRAIIDTAPETDFTVEVADGDPAGLVGAAEAAVRKGDVDHIIAAGGDGTMAAIATVLQGSDVALAPLPGGTMNALSRDLGFAADLESAIGQLPAAQRSKIDLAFVGEHVCLNNVVFGAYARVAVSREEVRDADTLLGKVKGVADVVSSLTNADLRRYTVKFGGHSISIDSNTLMVANNIYTGADAGRPLRKSISGGRLGVYVINSQTPGDFLSVLFDAVSSGLTSNDMVDLHETDSCVVNNEDSTLEATVDGETKDIEGPLKIVIKPQALTVLRPENAGV